MAGQANAHRRRRNQFHSRNVFGDTNFVTRIAPESDGGMDRLALRLVLMAGSTLRRIGVFIELDWVYVGQGCHPKKQNKAKGRR
jgi:hypothetical protein